jgi:hypothetical protein
MARRRYRQLALVSPLIALGASCLGACRRTERPRPVPVVAPRQVPAGAWPKTPKPVVTANLVTVTLDSVLPFDRPFVLRVPTPAGTDSMRLRYGTYDCMHGPQEQRRSCRLGEVTLRATPLVATEAMAAAIGPLPPNNAYAFQFDIWGKRKINDTLTPLRDDREVVGWTATDFRDHFDTDFGAIYGTRSEYVGLGIMLHVYAEPIRPFERLSDVESRWRRWKKRVNLAAGISLAELSDEKPVDHMFSFGTPVAAIGARKLPAPPGAAALIRTLIEQPRWAVGVIWFTQDDANPLITRKKTKADPFVSMTFDLDLKSILGPLYGVIGLED